MDGLDPGSLARLLTLRYDPLEKPVRPRVRPTYFLSKDIQKPETVVADIAEKELGRLHQLYRFNRVALSLSGGIDSRLTLALLKQFLPEVKVSCISVGFGHDDDETQTAREIARLQDADFEELIVDNVLEDLPFLIHAVKAPRWNLYQFYPLEHGKKFSNVFFTGDGGDETFAGYTFRYQKFLSSLPRRALWETRARLYISCHERDWVPDQPRVFGPAVDFSWSNVVGALRQNFDNVLDPLDQVFMADYNGKLLFDWLPANISFSKALGTKIESVFLAPKMVKFAFSIDWHLKYDPASNTGKLPLATLLSSYEKRPVMVTKKGFSVNLPSIWRSYAMDIARTYLDTDSEVVKNGIINNTWIQKTFRALPKESLELNPRYINKVLQILALEIWYRLFVSKTLKPGQKLYS